MRRISTATRVVNKFGAGKDGFTNGNPSTGVAATDLEDQFFDHVQEEICTVVEGMGLVVDGSSRSQLQTAIKMMIDQQSGNYALDTGAANAYVVALDPPITAYTDGMTVRFRAANANTGASTLNAGGGVKAMRNNQNGALFAGDIAVGSVVTAIYIAALDAFQVTSLVISQTGLHATGITTVAATGNLPNSAIGGTVLFNAAAAITSTLPAANSVPGGARLEFMNVNSGSGTVTAAGSDTIKVNASTVASLVMGAGDTLTLESDGTSIWYAVAGSVQFVSAATYNRLKNVAPVSGAVNPGTPAASTTYNNLVSLTAPTNGYVLAVGALNMAAQSGGNITGNLFINNSTVSSEGTNLTQSHMGLLSASAGTAYSANMQVVTSSSPVSFTSRVMLFFIPSP